MKKKTGSILLTGILLASAILSGCAGGKEEPKETKETKTAEAETGDVRTTDEKETEQALEKVEVTIASGRADTYAKWEDMTVIKQLQENISDCLSIDWLDWPAAVAGEKINLAMNSGEYPDAMIGTWLLSTQDTANYAGQEIIVPLEDYITEELTPNLYALFEARPEYKEALKSPDGHIYALPSYNETTAKLRTINDTILINTEWLKAVGKEMPTTTEELYDVLVAFRDAGDLNGNGIADEVPMTCYYGTSSFGDHQYGLHSIIGWFGVCTNKIGITKRDNGEIVFPGIQPEWKEAVEYLHRLYYENLLDKEIFTMAKEAYSAKCKSQTPVAGVLVWWSSYAIDTAVGEGVYQYLPPLTSPNGEKPSWQYRNFPISDNLAFWVTDKGANKLPQLMKFIDQFYDQDLGVELALGVKGKYLEEVSENVYNQLTDAEGKAYSDEVKSADVPLKYSPFLLLKESYQTETETPGNLAGLEAMKVYGDYVEPEYTYLNAWLTGEESQELSILSVDIGEHYRRHLAEWVVNGGIEKEWDDYVAAYQNLELDKWIDIRITHE